ncbi:hypothetical protein GC163_12090 [bacterium]|nr:hypothetical protein [bacterium]
MSTVLIVTWDKLRVSALQCDGGHSHRIAAVWSESWPEGIQPVPQPEMAGKWLADQWRSAGLTATQVHVIVPREDVVLRHLELPQAPDDELADMVRFQAASRSTVPIEHLSLDYLPLPSVTEREGRDVLAITLPKASLEAIRRLVSTAQRELVGVSFSAHALGEWGEQTDRRLLTTRPDNSNESTVVIAIEQDRVELTVVTGHELTFAHAARITLEDDQTPTSVILAEVSRTMVAGRRLRPGLRVDHAWLIGGDATLAEALVERLECPVQPVNPTQDHAQAGLFGGWQERPASAAILLGATTLDHPITAKVNLLKPRQPPPKRDPRKQQLAVFSALALFVIFFFSGGNLMRLRSLDLRIEELFSERSRLKDSVEAGRKFVKHAELIDNWAVRDRNQLEQLVELESLMPGGLDRPYLLNYEFTVGTRDVLGDIVATAAAQTREDVEALQRAITEQSQYKLVPHSIEYNDRAEDTKYSQRYKLDLDLLKKKPAAATADTTAAKPTT